MPNALYVPSDEAGMVKARRANAAGTLTNGTTYSRGDWLLQTVRPRTSGTPDTVVADAEFRRDYGPVSGDGFDELERPVAGGG